jgi:hypothetical protein
MRNNTINIDVTLINRKTKTINCVKSLFCKHSMCHCSYGVSNNIFALLNIPLTIVKVFIPFCITQTKRPLTWYYRAYLSRLVTCIIIGIFVCLIPYIFTTQYFYPILVSLLMINESLTSLMLVSRVGFYAQISDPSIGGTYITLLSMLGNLSASLTSSAVLYAADWIQPMIYAYPLLVAICFLLGCCWFLVQYRTMLELQALPLDRWYLKSTRAVLNPIADDVHERCLNDEHRSHSADNR